MKYSIKFIVFAAILTVLACVEPYDLNFGSQKEILFIEADINNFDKNQFIKIKKNIPSANSIEYVYVESAKVYLIENEKNIIECKYAGDGKYNLPIGFLGKLETSYKLRFELDEKIYESSSERASPVAPIEKIYATFSQKGISYLGKEIDGHNIFIDIKDINPDEQFYLWQWRLFEKQGYCKSCEGGKFYTSPLPLGKCIDDANLKRRNVIYDYVCGAQCWDIFYNEDVNIMSDKYSNGKNIQSRLVAKIPFFQYRNALIEVQQYAISQSAFAYFNILINQSQRNGSLADTPPAGLIGNVRNLGDATEPVGGIFMVSAKTTKSYTIDRTELISGVRVIGLFKGRQVTPEPLENDTTRPPLAPCVEDRNRTDKKPIGWVD
jgi:hypothetical protein